MSEFDEEFEELQDWVHVVVGLLILGSMFGLLLLFGIFPGFWDRVAQDDGEGHIEKARARLVLAALLCMLLCALHDASSCR